VLAVLAISPPTVPQVSAEETAGIYGRVTDGATGTPIANASLVAWYRELGTFSLSPIPVDWKLGDAAVTGSDGRFNLTQVDPTKVETSSGYGWRRRGRISGKSWRVCVVSDDPATPGVDYVPTQIQIFEEDRNVSVQLFPSGSLTIEGEIRFVEAGEPPQIYQFNVADPVTGQAVTLTSGLAEYGPYTDYFLAIGARTVVVPVNTSFTLTLAAVNREVSLSPSGFEPLDHGEARVVQVDPVLAAVNLDTVQRQAANTSRVLVDAEATGYYLAAERQDLVKVTNLIASAIDKSTAASYAAAFVDLREAYLLAAEITRVITDNIVEASRSVIFLVLFFALSAAAMAYIFASRPATKLALTLGFDALFVTLFFVVYPGARYVPLQTFALYAGAALGATLLTAFVVPRVLLSREVSVLSLAKRNLVRRRTRTLLSVASVMVIAMSFVALTSFSTPYGFQVRLSHTLPKHADALLVRKPTRSDAYNPSYTPTTQLIAFTPLSRLTLDWVAGTPGIQAVAPKVENTPLVLGLGEANVGILRSDTTVQPLLGVVGVHPSSEVAFTQLSELVVAGAYLDDGDVDGCLLSTALAAKLEVDVGATLLLDSGGGSTPLTLVGLLDDRRLQSLTDLDRQSFLPKKILLLGFGEESTQTMVTCDAAEVIVVNWASAFDFPFTAFARIGLLPAASTSSSELARQLALEYDFWVWNAVAGSVFFNGLTAYMELKGLAVLVPWAISVLMVMVTVLNAMFERRREIAILSSVGLNPSNILGVFTSEAAMIGVFGGGFGYLLGLGAYPLLATFSAGVIVRQKISAVWSLGSIAVALITVVASSLLASRYSLAITPMLRRRWRSTEQVIRRDAALVFPLPFRIDAERVGSLLRYIGARLDDAIGRYAFDVQGPPIEVTAPTDATANPAVLRSNYYLMGVKPDVAVGNCPFEVRATRERDGGLYALELTCFSLNESWAYATADFVRQSVIAWREG
jgi:ABC-type lipoprotein release transport system permease subunit